jgi:F0F1-type ATP synthase assembly protein I
VVTVGAFVVGAAVVGAGTDVIVGASTGWLVVAVMLGVLVGAVVCVSAFAIDTALNKPPTATNAAAAPSATDFFSMP